MISMRYPINLAAALLLLHVLASHATEQNVGLEIGIAPILPIKTMVQNYAPLREYLQNQLKEPVTIVSAPDYKTFFLGIQKREYPIIITIASSAYLASVDHQYIPMLQPLNFTHPVVVIANSQTFNQLADLRGKTIAMSDSTAVVSMQGIQMLREAGLVAGRDLNIKHLPNHGAAVNYVITGEAVAAIVSNRAFMQMASAVREQVKIVYTWEKGSLPGVVFLGSSDVPFKRREQIKKTILEFSQNTPQGKKFMLDMGYGGLQNIEPADLQKLAPCGEMLKKALAKETGTKNHK